MKKGTIKLCRGCTDYECFVKFVEDGKATIIKKMDTPKKEVKDYVEKIAKGKNPNISATQSQKVFKEDSEMNEASPISVEELPPDKQKLVKDIFKGTTYDFSKQTAFDGIHGQIVTFRDQFGTPSVRLNKKALQKILKDKNVRWVDVSSIGF